MLHSRHLIWDRGELTTKEQKIDKGLTELFSVRHFLFSTCVRDTQSPESNLFFFLLLIDEERKKDPLKDWGAGRALCITLAFTP